MTFPVLENLIKHLRIDKMNLGHILSSCHVYPGNKLIKLHLSSSWLYYFRLFHFRGKSKFPCYCPWMLGTSCITTKWVKYPLSHSLFVLEGIWAQMCLFKWSCYNIRLLYFLFSWPSIYRFTVMKWALSKIVMNQTS